MKQWRRAKEKRIYVYSEEDHPEYWYFNYDHDPLDEWYWNENKTNDWDLSDSVLLVTEIGGGALIFHF